jgi:replicative DNA helicase
LLCSRAQVNLSNVRDGFLTDLDFHRLTLPSQDLAKAPTSIDDTGGLSTCVSLG